MFYLIGRAALSLAAFFGQRLSSWRWQVANTIIPVTEVGVFLARFNSRQATTSATSPAFLTVPAGKRWFVYWVDGASNVSGTQEIRLIGDHDLRIANNAASTIITEMVLSYLEAGQSIRYTNSGGTPNLTLTAWVSEFDA